MEDNTNVAPENESVESDEQQSLSDKVRVIAPWKLVVKRFFRSKLSIVGLVIIILMFLFSFVGPVFTGWGETEVDRNLAPVTYSEYDVSEDVIYVKEFRTDWAKLAAPFSRSSDGRVHVLGCDKEGMDVLTRLMYGGRISLTLSLMVVFVNTLLGMIIGGLAGYLGGGFDMAMMRIIDIINCIPQLPIMLIISALLDEYKLDEQFRIYVLLGALTILSWTGIARLVRGQILYLREQEFIVAAEAGGFSTPRKVFKHLIPNIIPQLIVSMTLSLGNIILFEATLSYLNLGVPYPQASWGKMVNLAKDTEILSTAPWVWAPSGVTIILSVLGFNFLGDGLRDAFDPKMKK